MNKLCFSKIWYTNKYDDQDQFLDNIRIEWL